MSGSSGSESEAKVETAQYGVRAPTKDLQQALYSGALAKQRREGKKKARRPFTVLRRHTSGHLE
ncbi:hypothetical protein N7540_004603 [Penicillium herquei]|nr:hypothetical protein N7540_004603 [Penicillium herquei]